LLEDLVLVAELKTLPYPGGIYNQPAWFMEHLSWFLPRYDFMKFLRKADMILGGKDTKNIKDNPNRARSNKPVIPKRR
jgi:hypothetical protein